MSVHTIHLRSENPELLIEFDLPPGTHARVGASPKAEITLPLGGIPPFSFIVGRFHDGRLYLADLDEAISQRLDLPTTLLIAPYQFAAYQPVELAEDTEESTTASPTEVLPRSGTGVSEKLKAALARFAEPTTTPPSGTSDDEMW